MFYPLSSGDWRARNKHFMKKYIFYLGYFLIVITLSSCGNSQRSNNQWKDPELVEVQNSDRSVQYYLPFNIQSIATGQPWTINDLQASGRLLLTYGGNVKAMGFSDGYKRVYSFRCEPIGAGWYQITCWLKSPITKETYTMKCYTREKI